MVKIMYIRYRMDFMKVSFVFFFEGYGYRQEILFLGKILGFWYFFLKEVNYLRNVNNIIK